MKLQYLLFAFLCLVSYGTKAQSVYTQAPSDKEALFFTSENFHIQNDGKQDVSEELQQAINQLKKEENFGILFIPEGKYWRIST